MVEVLVASGLIGVGLSATVAAEAPVSFHWAVGKLRNELASRANAKSVVHQRKQLFQGCLGSGLPGRADLVSQLTFRPN